MNKKIFISTGEVSGDLHGSLLSKALFDEARKHSIDLEIHGLGGEKMRNEGVQIFQDTTSISAIGIWEALPLIIPMMKVQKKFYRFINKYRPNCLILIDYMGPNINIGMKLNCTTLWVKNLKERKNLYFTMVLHMQMEIFIWVLHLIKF